MMEAPSARYNNKRASWRRTWAGAGPGPAANYSPLPLTTEADTAGPRASWSHTQSPQPLTPSSTRYTLDLSSLRSFVSKLSRSRKKTLPETPSFFSPPVPGTATSNDQTWQQHFHNHSDSKVIPHDTNLHHSMEGVQVMREDIEPVVHALFEHSTARWQYLIADPTTKDAIIIDPVLDRNPYAPGIDTTAADHLLYLVRQHQYHVVRILETHSVQEHPTSAWYLRTQLRDRHGQMPRICTGKAIAGVQRMFARAYGVQDAGWSARFDSFHDGQVFAVGEMRVQCVHLLSEPDWFGFVIGHNVFLGKEVPTDMTESAAVRPTQQIPLRKLARYVNDYTFHPQKQEDVSRPSTNASEVSQWMHEPTAPATPRASMSMRHMMNKQHSMEARSSVSSLTSSVHSHRRISQIPELA